MKILVCIKQVPDPESNLKLNADSSWIEESNKIAYRMNRYDEYALEEALIIKDNNYGVTIDVITVGSEHAISTVKKSLEKGADNGILIQCSDLALSAIETASLISEYAKDKHYDIIFTGVMSEDLMQSQVGPMISSALSIPCAVSVVKSELINNLTALSVDSELEGGIIEKIEISLPCLITIQTGVNKPRYPSLSNVIRARSMRVLPLNGEDMNSGGNYNDIISIGYPVLFSKGIVIDGTSEEKADKLLNIFHEKGLI